MTTSVKLLTFPFSHRGHQSDVATSNGHICASILLGLLATLSFIDQHLLPETLSSLVLSVTYFPNVLHTSLDFFIPLLNPFVSTQSLNFGMILDFFLFFTYIYFPGDFT